MPAEDRPDLSIVVVSYNVAPYLAVCLEALTAGCGELAAEVFVVDNASGDGSVDLVREKFLEVTLLANGENRGFAAAVNQALPLTRGRYVLLLNPDTVTPPGSLARLVALADTVPAAGLLSPALRHPETGVVSRPFRAFPTWRSAFAQHTLVRWLLPRRALTPPEPEQAGRPTAAGWLGGACLLIRRALLEAVGPLDGRFFMWCEDIDYSRRAIAAGWLVYYADAIVVDHYGGKSTGQVWPGDVVFRLYQSLLGYLERAEPRRARLLTRLFKVALLTSLVLRLPAYALKAMGYGVAGSAGKTARYRRRLRRTVAFLGRFTRPFLRL